MRHDGPDTPFGPDPTSWWPAAAHAAPSQGMTAAETYQVTAVRSAHPATATVIDRHPHLVIRLRAGDPTALRHLRAAGLPGDVTDVDVLAHANATAMAS